jgi:hypothetical protein
MDGKQARVSVADIDVSAAGLIHGNVCNPGRSSWSLSCCCWAVALLHASSLAAALVAGRYPMSREISRRKFSELFKETKSGTTLYLNGEISLQQPQRGGMGVANAQQSKSQADRALQAQKRTHDCQKKRRAPWVPVSNPRCDTSLETRPPQCGLPTTDRLTSHPLLS